MALDIMALMYILCKGIKWYPRMFLIWYSNTDLGILSSSHLRIKSKDLLPHDCLVPFKISLS